LDNTKKQSQNEIASYIGRLLREAFGKGPQSIFVSISRPYIVIYLRKFLAPTEQILLQQAQILSILNTRDLVMKSLIPEIKAYLLLLTGMNIAEFYYDWGMHNHSGIFVGIESGGEYVEAAPEEYAGQKELHQEIGHISQQVQKKPDAIYSCMLNERTLLVIREGILINIGKELMRLGFEESLKLAERNLEMKYLRSSHKIQQILKTEIADVFADWNFRLDKSVIVFILNPVN